MLFSHLQRNLIQLFAFALGALDHAKEDISVNGALVSFIQDHDCVAQKQRVSNCLSQQHAIGHELKLGFWGCHVLESYRVAHLCYCWSWLQIVSNV